MGIKNLNSVSYGISRIGSGAFSNTAKAAKAGQSLVPLRANPFFYQSLEWTRSKKDSTASLASARPTPVFSLYNLMAEMYPGN
jgi:hypothetical protein